MLIHVDHCKVAVLSRLLKVLHAQLCGLLSDGGTTSGVTVLISYGDGRRGWRVTRKIYYDPLRTRDHTHTHLGWQLQNKAEVKKDPDGIVANKPEDVPVTNTTQRE